MINLAIFFLRHWRVVLPVVCALLIAASFYGGRIIGYQAGYRAAEKAYETEQAQSLIKAQEKISNAGKKYDEKRNQIRSIQGDNPIAGPRVSAAIDSLP